MIFNDHFITFLNTNQICSWQKACSAITYQVREFLQLYIKSKNLFMYICTHTHIYIYTYIYTYVFIHKYICIYTWYIYVYMYIHTRPVETGGLGGGCWPPHILVKVDFLPIDNDSDKKKIAKKCKLVQISRKLLVTLLLYTSCSA